MYKIEKNGFSYHLTFEGFMQKDEMEKWYQDSLKALSDSPEQFGVFVDMRNLKPLPVESQSRMEEGQKHYKEKGMIRSVVILDNPITTMQFKRIGKQSGINNWERYIDSSEHADWKSKGIDWLEKGIDPDKS